MGEAPDPLTGGQTTLTRFAGADQLHALRDLLGGALDEGALTRGVKLLMVSLEASVVGAAELARWSAAEAQKAGISEAAMAEAELTCALSRGLAGLESPVAVLNEIAHTDEQRASEREPGATTADMVAFLISQNPAGAGPVREMAASAATALRGYYQLRRTVLADGALPRRHKELLLVGINAVERFSAGIAVHLAAAKACGASRGEAVETLLTALAVGGIPAWQHGCPPLASIFGGAR
jgi:alkylhydroperoxidase/carboxymuconolactone decarboxylase family protein YurZ